MRSGQSFTLKNTLGVDMKQHVSFPIAWSARKLMVLAEYQYWLKFYFYLCFIRNRLGLLGLLYILN